MGDEVTFSSSLNPKKVMIIENKNETIAITKANKIEALDKEDEELVLNPVLDSD